MKQTIGTGISTDFEFVLFLDDMAGIIDELRSSSLSLQSKDFAQYLNNSYEIISHQLGDPQAIRLHYLTSLSIYAFGESLLELEISDKMRRGFSRLLTQKYGIENPLELYFREANGSSERVEEGVENDRFLVAPVCERGTFGTKVTMANILRETWRLSHKLKGRKHQYDLTEHLVFSGLYNVALPLVGAYKQRINFSDLYKLLKETKGEFVFNIPKFGD